MKGAYRVIHMNYCDAPDCLRTPDWEVWQGTNKPAIDEHVGNYCLTHANEKIKEIDREA